MKLFLLIILILISAPVLVTLVWFYSFVWENSYGGKTILIDSISVQLTIFEMLLALADIVIAIMAFFGYQKIKEDITDKINKSIDDIIYEKINSVLDERGYYPTKHATDTASSIKATQLKTTSKDKFQDNVGNS